MADSSQQNESAVENGSAQTSKPAPTSPARSDKSSDSEGKPVRDKLKETRIDAQGISDPVPPSDQHMEEVANGSANVGEQSASGSDSDRGRLRRKRSREDFEDDTEAEKQPEKKQEKEERHHVRKRSRDVKDIESGLPLKPPAASVTRIEEHDGDEQMTSPNKDTSKVAATKASTETDTSPKNKRTRDQVEEGTAANAEPAEDAIANGKPTSKSEDERDSKRLRDKDEPPTVAKATQATTKVCSSKAAPKDTNLIIFLDTTWKRLCKYFGGLSLCCHVSQATSIQNL
jgi:Ran-binding protein 3